MQQKNSEKTRKIIGKNSGITLIALIVTIIVLLILAGISITMLVGENGLITKANWSKFVTEYGTVKEGKDLYEIEKQMNKSLENSKINDKVKRLATTEKMKIADSETNSSILPEENNTNITNKYPVDVNAKVENSSIVSTLVETIKYTENLEEITDEKVSLYKVDMSLIKLDIKDEYVINIKTGELYKLKGVKYQGKTYHRPDWGVGKNGEIEEEPEDTSDTIYLKISQKKQLTTILKDAEVEWATSDESIVTVDQKGEITGVAKGKATITISYKTEDTGEDPSVDKEEESGTEEGEEEKTVINTQTYTVIVEGGIPENFGLSLEDKTIYEYQTEILEAKIEGKKVGTGYLEWESSDENIVKVDAQGRIKGLKQGEAIITCKWKEDETKTATCKITVKTSDTLVLDKTQMNVTINQTGKIIAKYKETEVTNIATWKSNDENIVTVEKGKVKGIALGETVITAEYAGEVASCKITVKDIITEVYTIEDLSLFANQVNEGINFEGKTVNLINDLDFKHESSYESKESTEYANYYIGTTTWVRIGDSTSNYFSGTFDGNGNTINNLYINATTAKQGLFGYSNGGNFKNLTLKDVNINSTSYQVGAVLGYGTNINISNCRVSGSINSTGKATYNHTGGIVGFIGTAGGNINNCINEATIEGTYSVKGGIVGEIYKGTITNCINKGKVISDDIYIAGIAGSAGWSKDINYRVAINNCKNYGEIEGWSYVGGIAGGIEQSSIINCTNYKTGNVKAIGRSTNKYNESSSGGIVGQAWNKRDSKIENCNNYANVSGEYYGTGGIIGISMSAIINNCNNEGTITGSTDVGGITGQLGYYSTTRKIYAKSTMENCINKGVVNGTGFEVGGVTGYVDYGSNINNCNNYADVTGTGKSASGYASVGGIAGAQGIYAYKDIETLIENCNNYGNIEATYTICGGIVGWQMRGIIKNCTNEGNVITKGDDAGGITGDTGSNSYKTSGKIENCLNKGDITAEGGYAGGISSFIIYGSSITTSGNTGNIVTNGYIGTGTNKGSRTGGIVGAIHSTGENKVTYCYNTGNVTGSYGWIGGIAGISSSYIEHCYSTGKITGPADIGGVVGCNKSGTVTESYYLNSSVEPTEGTETEEGTSESETTIKSLINLNVWKDYFKADKTPNVNKGFPILKWQ